MRLRIVYAALCLKQVWSAEPLRDVVERGVGESHLPRGHAPQKKPQRCPRCPPKTFPSSGKRSPHQMPGEEASISSGPRTVIALFVLLAPPLFAALAALAWILVQSFASTDGEVPETPPFCCPDAMETILTLSNLTNDPCTDFLSYACYRKSEVDRTAVAVRAFMSAVVHPTLQAKLRSPVSDKIWTSHKSCLFAAVRKLFTPEHAVTAVIDLFHRWSGTSTSSPSASMDLVRLVSVLHFSYDISSVFSTYYKLSSKSDEAATFVICFRLAPDIGFVTLRDEHATFEAARRHAGVNASRADVSRLASRFRGARKTSVDENIIVPMALLDEKFPKEALSTWQDILSTLPAIAVKNPPDVAAVVRILMDESTLFQATALLYFSISTTLLMFSEEIRRAPSLADNAALCEGLTLELSPLWDVLATQQMTNPVRDQVVMRLYHRVSESVIADAQLIFASYVGSEKVQRVVQSMRVVLAANLTSSYVRYLPVMSDDYFANKFEMRRFYSQLIKSNALRGLYGLYTLGVDLSRSFISRIEDQIAVAANVYALLSFSNDTGRGERSESVQRC
ncbi:hypothetical protein HPB51_022896 [Rhipicephalus microplus]|uniref:Peptidase M13 N-terminal domain-containing protein n=1 Tax=Rhipicephalus microplus TaxID=6941 RepID=A0A9J6DQU3_RHIMP|nr:hypothetical protein HPB51_022896 [Rhipicephalus microplus]